MTIKAIETRYKGYRFRSRLEARWAVFFDALGVPYEYEKQGFDLGEVGWYLPDFWLPREKEWVEIKPAPWVKCQYLYLAGKMTGWRHALDLRGHHMTGPHEEKSHNVAFHGSSSGEISIVDDCLDGIIRSDAMVCWIDRLDCYGTLIEAGYAHARNIPIHLGIAPVLYPRLQAKAHREADNGGCNGCPDHALWFLGTICRPGIHSSPQAIIDHVVPAYTADEKKCAALATDAHSVNLVYGEPHPGAYSVSSFCSHRCSSRERVWDQGDRTNHIFPSWGSRREPATVVTALLKARGARFEHGETPR